MKINIIILLLWIIIGFLINNIFFSKWIFELMNENNLICRNNKICYSKWDIDSYCFWDYNNWKKYSWR